MLADLMEFLFDQHHMDHLFIDELPLWGLDTIKIPGKLLTPGLESWGKYILFCLLGAFKRH